jgi:hypothetical protein
LVPTKALLEMLASRFTGSAVVVSAEAFAPPSGVVVLGFPDTVVPPLGADALGDGVGGGAVLFEFPLPVDHVGPELAVAAG